MNFIFENKKILFSNNISNMCFQYKYNKKNSNIYTKHIIKFVIILI
jgi:hypothetical protein